MFKIDTIFYVDKSKTITESEHFLITMHKATCSDMCSTECIVSEFEHHYCKL